MLNLVKKDYLISSVKYCLLNGWQGLVQFGTMDRLVPYCLEGVELIPPYDRATLELTFARLISWSINELRSLVIKLDQQHQPRINAAVCSNGGMKVKDVALDVVWPSRNQWHSGQQPLDRFIITLIGMLTADHHSSEVSLLHNSSVLAITQTLLRIIGMFWFVKFFAESGCLE